MTQQAFIEVIGQDSTKARLWHNLRAYPQIKKMPHFLLLGSKGCGKTLIAKEIGRALYFMAKELGFSKKFVEANASTIRSVKDLFDKVFYSYCDGEKHATFFFDEVHGFTDKIVTVFLSILNKSDGQINRIEYDGKEYVFDFSKLTFIFATTERQEIFEALLSRMTEVQLIDYTYSELGAIIERNLTKSNKTIKADKKALLELASFCKGSGRSASLMGQDEIAAYCVNKKKNKFEKTDVKPLVKVLDLFPFGLTRLEFQILKAIAEHSDGSSLNMLAAKSGLTKAAQMDIERIFLRYGLMEIDGKRKITRKGLDYIRTNEKALLA